MSISTTAPRPTLIPDPRYQRVGRLGLAMLDIYAIMPVIYIVLRVLAGRDYWLVATMGNFIHLPLCLSFPLVLMVLALRRWRLMPLLAVQIVAFVWLFGGLFVPKNPDIPDGVRLRVMTFNIASYISDPTDITRAIRESDADIVGMQETSEDHAAYLDEHLADIYPYRRFEPIPGNVIQGKGFLSRYPIINYRVFWLNAPFPYQRVVVDVEGVQVTVIVAHSHFPPFIPSPSADVRATSREMAGIYDQLAEDRPALVLCDCNITDQDPGYPVLAEAGLVDSFREAGWGFGGTFKSLLPVALARIDYIWHSDHFRAVEAWVGQDASSDHLPLLADLVLVEDE